MDHLHHHCGYPFAAVGKILEKRKRYHQQTIDRSDTRAVHKRDRTACSAQPLKLELDTRRKMDWIVDGRC